MYGNARMALTRTYWARSPKPFSGCELAEIWGYSWGVFLKEAYPFDLLFQSHDSMYDGYTGALFGRREYVL